jgi:hypothetical protein
MPQCGGTQTERGEDRHVVSSKVMSAAAECNGCYKREGGGVDGARTRDLRRDRPAF